jgi:hypothetical protein
MGRQDRPKLGKYGGVTLKQIHIDTETLGIKHTSRLLSIGAVCGASEFYVEVDQTHYTDKFTTCDSTAAWWERQGVFIPTAEQLLSPHAATLELMQFVMDETFGSDDFEVWANSPSFDCAIIRYHCQQFSSNVPWAFWQERDVRTIKNFAKAMRIKTHVPDNPHHALEDAKNQRDLVDGVYAVAASMLNDARNAKFNISRQGAAE